MSRASNEPEETDDDAEWKYAIDEVGPDGVVEEATAREEEAGDSGPIEPEPIDLEHAVFVALGAVLTVTVLFVGI